MLCTCVSAVRTIFDLHLPSFPLKIGGQLPCKRRGRDASVRPLVFVFADFGCRYYLFRIKNNFSNKYSYGFVHIHLFYINDIVNSTKNYFTNKYYLYRISFPFIQDLQQVPTVQISGPGCTVDIYSQRANILRSLPASGRMCLTRDFD